MDEFDTQGLMAELSAQEKASEQVEVPVEAPAEEVKPQPEETKETKMYDESLVKALRAENAKYRIRAREAEAKLNTGQYTPFNTAVPGSQVTPGIQATPVYPQYTAPAQTYDPRVDSLLAEQADMKLANKLTEIKADPYFSELFNDVDDMGVTFEEKLLEKAVETQWPLSELDALVFKMEKDKLLGRVKQKGIDEAYKSMSTKAATAPDVGVSSGKNVEDSEIKSVDDAVKAAMKFHGVTDLSQLR